MNYFDYTISELHEKLVNKELTAEELTKSTLENIKKADDKLNSFITVDQEKAIEQAKSIDSKGIDANNMLSGIPLALKDNISTKGIKTTAASKMLENFVPVYDATVVEKLNKADYINIGKTNMDEFAMGSSSETSYYGPIHNPWNLNKVPGGSSGGSAAAVASGEVIAALGTDTGGSIRQPAAFNGIYGIKPTYGRVSRWGVIAFSSSLDQVGVLSRRVADSAIVLNKISGGDEHDTSASKSEVPDYYANLNSDLKGKKIAVPKEFMSEEVSEDVLTAVKKGIDFLEESGAIVEFVSTPSVKLSVETYFVIASSEASSNLQRYDGIRYGHRADNVKNLDDVYVKSRSEGFGNEVKRRIMLGTYSLSAGAYDAYFKKAAQVRTLMINELDNIFKSYDLIVGPTTPNTAFDINSKKDPVAMYMNDVLTIPANMAGLPAASVPVGMAAGMPVGLQIIGKPFDEQGVLNASLAVEENFKFYENKPTGMED